MSTKDDEYDYLFKGMYYADNRNLNLYIYAEKLTCQQ